MQNETIIVLFINEHIVNIMIYAKKKIIGYSLINSLYYQVLYVCKVVVWAIDQKNEARLKRELKRIRVSFNTWEERGDDKNNTSVKKWTQPSGRFISCYLVENKMQFFNVSLLQADLSSNSKANSFKFILQLLHV